MLYKKYEPIVAGEHFSESTTFTREGPEGFSREGGIWIGKSKNANKVERQDLRSVRNAE